MTALMITRITAAPMTRRRKNRNIGLGLLLQPVGPVVGRDRWPAGRRTRHEAECGGPRTRDYLT
ncbi:hypothetical protein GCM10009677_56500 [Sphaerisporangium rubeum]